MPIPLYDWSQNSWSDVPESDVTTSVAAGTHSFHEDQDVPAMSPQGEYGTIPATHVQEAFQKGFRFATADDVNAWQDRGKQESMARITGAGDEESSMFGGFKTALATAVPALATVLLSPQEMEARAQGLINLLPGANYGVRKIASALGNSADDDTVKDIQSGIEKAHPINSAIGNVAGAMVSPLVGGAASTLGHGVSGITRGLVEMGLGEGAAARIAGTIAARTAGSAVEAAYFTGADNISEAAIGNPDEVASNFTTSVASGMIFGGKLGIGIGALEAGATPLKKLAMAAAGEFPEMVNSAARAAVKKGLVAVQTLAGNRDLAQATGDLIDDPTARAFMQTGGLDAAKEAATKAGAAQDDFREYADGLAKDIKANLKSSSKQVNVDINEAVHDAQGNVGKAMDAMHGKNEAIDAELQQGVRMGMDPLNPRVDGTIYEDLAKITDDGLNKVASEAGGGVPGVTNRIKKILDYKTSQEMAAGIIDDRPSNAKMGDIGEFRAGREIRERVGDLRDSLNPGTPTHEAASALYDDLTNKLYEHPEFGENLARLDHGRDALADLSEAVGKTLDKEGSLPNSKIMRDMMLKPEYNAKVNAILQRLPELQPTFEAMRADGADLAAKLDRANQINDTINRATAGSSKLSVDQLSELADVFGDPELRGKVDKLSQIHELLTSDEPTYTKMIRIMREAGHPITNDLLSIERHQQAIENMAKLEGPGKVDGNYLTAALKGIAAHKLRHTLSAGIGAMIGGPLGAAIGGTASLAMTALTNPVRIVNTLTRLERFNTAAAGVLDQGVQNAIDGLTSGKINQQIFTNLRVYNTDRSQYARDTKYVQQLSADPKFRTDEFERKVGMIPGAPQISQALAVQFSRTSDFLASKVQQDPFASYSIHPSASPWAPNDMDLAKWNRYTNAAENPMTALQSIAEGTVTPEHVEALATVHPDIFARVQQGVMSAIINPNTRLSYQDRVNIGTVLGIPADATLRPQFILDMQATFADQKPAGQGGPGRPPTPKSNPKVQFDPATQSTDADRITYS